MRFKKLFKKLHIACNAVNERRLAIELLVICFGCREEPTYRDSIKGQGLGQGRFN